MTNARTINLPASTFLRNVDGKAVSLNWDELPDTVIEKIAEVGAKVLLTNVYNGGGKDATDAEKLAALMKKIDSWKRGEFNVVERGESQYTAWRDVFITDCVAAGMTQKAAESAIKAKVSERLGKDAKATFANYIEASAIEAESADMTRDQAREALEAYYTEESARREAAAAKAKAKVTVPTIDLSKFLKK